MSIDLAVRHLQAGGCVLLRDDASPGGASFLVGAASLADAEMIAFLVNNGRGLISAALTEERAQELGLAPMVREPSHETRTFTVSVEARHGVTTGISCADRATTLRTLALTDNPRRDLVMPGHIFPIVSRNGGVFVRSGAPEGAVDLVTLASLTPVATLCHCLGPEGEFATEEELAQLSARYCLPVIHLSDIVRERLTREVVIARIATVRLPTVFGDDFRAIGFRSLLDEAEHLAIVKGNIDPDAPHPFEHPVLVRVQAENRLGDLLGSSENPTREQIEGALQAISQAREGIFVYIRRPRRELLAREVEERFSSPARPNALRLRRGATSEAPIDTERPPRSVLREYGVGAQILRALKVCRIRLLTNSSREIIGLDSFGLEIVERIPFREHSPRSLNTAEIAPQALHREEALHG